MSDIVEGGALFSDRSIRKCRTLASEPLFGAGSIPRTSHISGYRSTILIGSDTTPFLNAGPEAINKGYRSVSLLGLYP